MMKGMVKEIAGGVVFLGGLAVVLLTAETIPVVAGLGAVASLGAGFYQAYASAHKTKLAQESIEHDTAQHIG